MGAFSRLVLAALLLGAVAAAPSPSAAWAAGAVLRVANPATGRSAALSLAGVRRVTIRFFHSYDRQWVSESFRLARGRLVPVEVAYVDDSYDYREQRYGGRARVERERVVLSGLSPAPSDRLARLLARVAFTKPQQLILSGPHRVRVIPFTRWGAPGQRLVFSLE